MQLILSVAYSIAHQKSIFYKATDEYRNFLHEFHKCSATALVFSFLFTFKFHHIMISFFAGGDHLKGEFNLPAWKV